MTLFMNTRGYVAAVALTMALTGSLLTAGGGAAGADPTPSPTPSPTPAGEPPQVGGIDLQWGDPNARSIGAGSCIGTFSTPRVVNEYLEYSLHSTCTGTDWWPHRVTLNLEVERSIFGVPTPFFRKALTDRSKITEEGSSYITVFVAEPCIDQQERTYRLTGKIEAGSHSKEGLDKEEVTVNCRVYNA